MQPRPPTTITTQISTPNSNLTINRTPVRTITLLPPLILTPNPPTPLRAGADSAFMGSFQLPKEYLDENGQVVYERVRDLTFEEIRELTHHHVAVTGKGAAPPSSIPPSLPHHTSPFLQGLG